MQERGKEFLGAGWQFPIQVEAATGRIAMSREEESIREAIYVILMTRPGERVMRPEFGCHIHDYLFQRADFPVQVQMENAVMEALVRWEPRIQDIHVKAIPQADGEQIAIEINYVVRSTNNPFNLVFPFYTTEGYGK